MSQHNCEQCRFKAKYDQNPNSWLGKLWRWHIRWCPGWNSYTASLDEPQRTKLANHYGLDCGPKNKSAK